jgi:hypothetical protein
LDENKINILLKQLLTKLNVCRKIIKKDFLRRRYKTGMHANSTGGKHIAPMAQKINNVGLTQLLVY